MNSKINNNTKPTQDVTETSSGKLLNAVSTSDAKCVMKFWGTCPNIYGSVCMCDLNLVTLEVRTNPTCSVLTVNVMQRFSSCKLLFLSLISKRSRCSNPVVVSISFSQRVIKTAIKNSIKGRINKGDSTSCAWRPNGQLCLCYQIPGQYTHFRLYKGNRSHGHVIAVYWLL